VVIDFSHASAVASLMRHAARARVAVVSGTTGLGAEEFAAVDEAARSVPVLWAPNFSLASSRDMSGWRKHGDHRLSWAGAHDRLDP
jgi:dihydrodipicolinate reductase